MINIEQVRLLESRVTKAIDYVNKLTGENTALKNKLGGYEKKIRELEVLIERFKEDQARIEEGIVSALNHLNRFEDDVEKTLAGNGEEASSAPPVPVPPPALAAVREPEQEGPPPREPDAGAGNAEAETPDDLPASYTEDEAVEESGEDEVFPQENQAEVKEGPHPHVAPASQAAPPPHVAPNPQAANPLAAAPPQVARGPDGKELDIF